MNGDHVAQSGPGSAPLRQLRGDDPQGGDGVIQPLEQGLTRRQVEAALCALPSRGWNEGWTGRRDRAVLVLSQLAGLSPDCVAALKVGDISVSDGVASIRTPAGTVTLERADDDRICGPCALVRWIRALDLTAVYPNGRVVAAVIARAAPVTANSPHLCEGVLAVSDSTCEMALLPTTDQWGPFAVVGASATPVASAALRSTVDALPRQRGGGDAPNSRTPQPIG